MEHGLFVTEFWLDTELNPGEFVKAFEKKFPRSEAEQLPLVADVRPGYLLFHIKVPTERREELIPFLNDYAKTHNAVHRQEKASAFPFNPYS